MATDIRDQIVKNRNVATEATGLIVKIKDMVIEITGLIAKITGLIAEITDTIERGGLEEIKDQVTGIGKEVPLDIEMREKNTQK